MPVDSFPALDELRSFLPRERLLLSPAALAVYGYDATGEQGWPEAVVLPESSAEVSQILTVATRHGIPVIGRGAGTNLSGGTVPRQGGWVLGFSRMNRLLAVDRTALRARVQPGLPNLELQKALAPYRLFYPPDPSSYLVSTIGGNVSENAGGPRCVRYGVTTQHIVGLTVALADGRLVRLDDGSASDRLSAGGCGGLDLRGVMTGSEGTLAILCEIELALARAPWGLTTLLGAFSSLENALRAVADVTAAGIVPTAMEVLDRLTIATVEPFVHAGYPPDADGVLLIDVEQDRSDGGEAAVDQIVALMRARGGQVQSAYAEQQREALWLGRRGAYGAAARVSRHVWTQDVTVPRSRLADMMERVRAISERHGVTILTVAHAGDGNLHPLLAYDPLSPDSVAAMQVADREILGECVALEGSITGEHGVGVDKLPNLGLMYAEPELEWMGAVKEAFDPRGLLNPGKAIPGAAELGRMRSGEWPLRDPLPDDEVSRLVRQGERWAIVGQGTLTADWRLPERVAYWRSHERHFALDRAELTVDVGAGLELAELEERLYAEGFVYQAGRAAPSRTVGGHLATGLAGPWESSAGHVRDACLALEVVRGDGQRLRLGSKAVKNVAGLDMVRLLIGSWGGLGLIRRATLRVRRLAETALDLQVPLSEPRRLLPMWQFLERGELRPAVCELIGGPDGWRLWLRWEGTASDSAWAATELQRLSADCGGGQLWMLAASDRGERPEDGGTMEESEGAALWQSLRRQLGGDGADEASSVTLRVGRTAMTALLEQLATVLPAEPQLRFLAAPLLQRFWLAGARESLQKLAIGGEAWRQHGPEADGRVGLEAALYRSLDPQERWWNPRRAKVVSEWTR